MPTIRQKLAFEKTMENQGNVSKAMKEAGYSKSHSKNPQSLTGSKGFKEMLARYAPEEALIGKAVQMLDQGEVVRKDFPAHIGIDKVKAMFKEARIKVLEVLENPSERSKIEVYYKQPDTMAQDKALDKLLRLHGLYEAQKMEHNIKGGFSLVELYERSQKLQVARKHANP